MSSSTRRPPLPARQSIRTRLLVLLLGLTTVSVLIIGYQGVYSVQRVGRSAQQISVEALRAQAEEYLRQVTLGGAQTNDLILRQVQRDAWNVAQYAAGVFGEPGAFAGEGYWKAEEHMFAGPDGQYLNSEADVSSAFVPNTVDLDEDVLRVLEMGAYLDFVFASTYESDSNTVAIYLGTEQETTQYYPNISLGTIVPPDFQVTQRPWYLKANPENNPPRAVVWSPIYVDATGKGLMVTAAAPVYVNWDDFVGVIGIDVTLADISANVEAVRLLGSGYSFLIDGTGQAIALPEQGYQDILGRPPESDEVGPDLSGVTTEFASVLAKMRNGSTGFDTLAVGGKELYVAYAPLESTGWSMANVVDVETVLQAVGTLQEELETSTRSLVMTRLLPVGVGILIIMGIVGLLVTNRLANPIQRLAAAAQQIRAGQWDVPLPEPGRDEIGVLSQAFASMTVRLRELLEGLERRVAERTYALERRSLYLEASAQVAREAAAIRDVSQLLNTTVHLISKTFGFYHAGIFLLDEAEEYAVLQAASSEGGQRMLARAHKLKVGEVGIVGHVAGTGVHRIALDVGRDAVYFNNPDLPMTRSEMALPLKVRGHLIGVLDVQSTEAAAFTDEDVAVLQTMADQVALAIDNADLLEQAEERLREVDVLLGRYSREGWQHLAAERSYWGYSYDGVHISPRDVDGVTGGEPQLTLPLQVRDDVIGQLELSLGEQSLTPDAAALAQDVAEQASQALESARLFQETRRTLTETEALYRTSRAIGAATSIEEVELALIEFAADTGVEVARVLLLERDERGEPTRLVVRQGWSVDDRPVQPYGTHLLLSDHQLADLVDLNEPIVIEDVFTDPRVSDAIRVFVTTTLGLCSLVMVPITVGKRWIGIFVVGRTQRSAFTDEFVRGYETLTGQAAVAIESMRLFEETQRRAERERLIGEITTRIRETLDVETVLKTAVQEIRQALGLPELVIRLVPRPGDGAGNVAEKQGVHAEQTSYRERAPGGGNDA